MVGSDFHVRGYDFDVDGFIATSRLQPFWIHHKGEHSGEGKTWEYSGLSLSLTKSDSLPEQISSATTFLEKHREDIVRLDSYGGEHRLISFCIAQRDTPGEHDRFPHEFLALAGPLRISIQLSRSVVRRP